MESLFLLIPLSIILISIAICIFIWAVKNRQFEDLDKEAHSILFDDDNNERQQDSKQNTETERDEERRS